MHYENMRNEILNYIKMCMLLNRTRIFEIVQELDVAFILDPDLDAKLNRINKASGSEPHYKTYA